MTRQLFTIEKGLEIVGENQDTGANVLQGSGAPIGTSGDTDVAPIGSVYLRTDDGFPYHKIADTSSASDWQRIDISASIDALSWRSEKVIALTNDTVTAGAGVDPSAWSDNDDGFTASAGQYVIGDADGSPALFEITGVGGSDTVIDQNTAGAGNRAFWETSDQWAQTFTASSSSRLDKVSVIISTNSASAGDIFIELRTVVGGEPGALLATSDTVLATAATGTQEFTFSTPYNLTSGVEYALYAGNTGLVGFITIEGDASDVYANGEALTNSGLGWSSSGDIKFSVIQVDPTIDLSAASDPIADNDTWIIQNFLPDPSGQENQAIFHVPVAGSAGVKISDVDWNFADGINLNSPYTPASGNITASDTLQTAVEKLDGNNDAQDSVLGTSQGDTDLGTFTTPLITDNTSVKPAFEELALYVEGLESEGKSTGVASSTVIDSILVDDFHMAEWEVVAWEEATPANKVFAKLSALHNGTASADATSVDDSVHTKLSLGTTGGNFLQISTALSGAAGAQVMQFLVDTNTAGLTVEWRRTDVRVQ